MELFAQKFKHFLCTDDFVLFSAVSQFANKKINEEKITICSFTFQRGAGVEVLAVEDYKHTSMVSEMATYLNSNQNKFHIMIAGLCDGRIDEFLDAISDKLAYEKIDNIVGGVSSGIASEEGEIMTYQYANGRLLKNGGFILSFSGVATNIGISLGFKAYGSTYKVRNAKGNRLYSIDNGKSFPYLIAKLQKGLPNDDVRNLWYCPLVFLDSKLGSTHILRTISNVTDEYVEFFASIPKESYFKLSFATEKDIIFSDKMVAHQMRKRFEEADVIFNFSCIARQYILEDKQHIELEAYKEIHEDTPLFGFFTFGEIGPDTEYKKLRFYNETSLAVQVREL